ncbi:unnamed protein product, partial [Linum tenue]
MASTFISDKNAPFLGFLFNSNLKTVAVTTPILQGSLCPDDLDLHMGDRETQHAKEKARLMCANSLFVTNEMVEDPEMIETEPTVEEPVKPASLPQTEIPPLAWGAGAGAKNFFSDVIAEEAWYIAESNSKDVVEAMKIDNLDDEVSQ